MEKRKVTDNGCGVPSRTDEDVLELDSGYSCNLGYILNTWEGILEKVDLILIFISVFKKEIVKVTLLVFFPFPGSLLSTLHWEHFSHKLLVFEYLFLWFDLFLAAPGGMWDLNSPPRIQPAPPVFEAWSLNHWITREVLKV